MANEKDCQLEELMKQTFYTVTDHNTVYGFKLVSIQERNCFTATCELLDEYKENDCIQYAFEEYNQKVYFTKSPAEKMNIFETKKEAVEFAFKNVEEQIDIKKREIAMLDKRKAKLQAELND